MLAVAGLGRIHCDRVLQHNGICDVVSAPHNAMEGMSAMRCRQHGHNFRAINRDVLGCIGSRRREQTA